MEKLDQRIKDRAAREETPVPDGFDGRLADKLDALPEKKKVRLRGPLRWAVAAAAVCALLTGTVLAVAPSLLEKYWGSFAPLVQEFDPAVDPDALGVYDGIEARIVSAVSDGYATICHVEFRDLEGDRIAQLMAQGMEAARGELQKNGFYRLTSYTDYTPDENDGVKVISYISGLDILDYDRETGVLTLEYTLAQTVPPGAERLLSLDLPAGFMRTAADEGSQAGSKDERYKWHLRAAIQLLPVRDVPLEDVQITLRDWETDPTITLREVMVSSVAVSVIHSAFNNVEVRYIELEAELADGSRVRGVSRWGSTFQEGEDVTTLPQIGGPPEYLLRHYTSTWILERAIEPDEVVGLWVDGVYIPLN